MANTQTPQGLKDKLVRSLSHPSGLRNLLPLGVSDLCNDQRGTIAITFALSFTIICGFLALAIDVASWQTSKQLMQGAADTAAYSAMVALNKNDGTSIITQANAITAANGYVNGQNGVTVAVNQPPTTGNYTSNPTAIEVIITQSQTRYLSGIFLSSGPVLTGRAVVAAASSCQSDAGGNDTGGASGTNFVLSNNETVTLPDMNGKTMHVSGYGTINFSHDANGATLIVDSSCVNVTSLGHDFNSSTFIANYVPPNMNKVSVAHSCNSCTFTNGSLGSGGVFAVGHDANGSSFTFNTCASCSASGQSTPSVVE